MIYDLANYCTFNLEIEMYFKKIKKAMIDQDFTVTKLAQIIGYTRGYVGNILNGHIVASVRFKKIIALALNEDYETLWSEGDASEL
jgi:transcriptional regulator with XRE-family HTH domain